MNDEINEGGKIPPNLSLAQETVEFLNTIFNLHGGYKPCPKINAWLAEKNFKTFGPCL